jgi:predicted CXXCH cytochrome family protein
VATPLASPKRSATDVAPVPHAGSAGAAPSLRSGQALKGGATLLVICLLSPFRLYAEEPIEHPYYIDPKDIKPQTCLICHPEKKEGKFVHTAVGMGCENCHRITSQKNNTTITLFATGGSLCAKCHEAKREAVLHGPYKEGQCLICHDPHSSEFKAQTRSAGNSLCLECHAPKPATAGTVSLFSVEEVSKADFEAIPKIKLDPTLRFGHPCDAHPVAEAADPSHDGERMSCLSCHAPHASTLPNLLVLAKGGGDLCHACHQAIDKQKEAKLESQQLGRNPLTRPAPAEENARSGPPSPPRGRRVGERRDCRNSPRGD